ncbi:hypothetical protein [Mongoliitalea daihaiensis]|uniref:hypothetical protein n=1 Tax=Mongoliitalea daihaiensis TaxID=2782006 RepID=UPI001F1A6624|nr:hypothetical protein [Mongoliitalea daihaiensis]UJP65120.1 hypothetical protein IPZ59_00305 [Mongoliitalea daihaiensis]
MNQILGIDWFQVILSNFEDATPKDNPVRVADASTSSMPPINNPKVSRRMYKNTEIQWIKNTPLSNK